MSETEADTVLIPGPLRLSNPVPPPVTVPLPIVASPHGSKNFWLGLLAFSASLICLPPAVFIAFALVMSALGSLNYQVGLGYYLFLLAICPFMLWFGVAWLAAALTCFWDAVRSGPVLEITTGGLRDYRSGLRVPWSSVRSARILGTAAAHSVDVQLNTPVSNWQSPFRVGVLFHRYRPIPDRVIVPTGMLDVPGHILTYAILTLVQRNGGEVSTKSLGYGGEGLKLLQRPDRTPEPTGARQ